MYYTFPLGSRSLEDTEDILTNIALDCGVRFELRGTVGVTDPHAFFTATGRRKDVRKYRRICVRLAKEIK